jgi:GAF domain-containing protein
MGRRCAAAATGRHRVPVVQRVRGTTAVSGASVRTVLWLHAPDRGAVPVTLPDGSGPFALGRDAQCEVVIDHPSISRRHAVLSRDGEAWRITDSGSKNGIRVAGHVVSEAPVLAGHWFSLGDVFATLEPMPERRWRDREAEITRRRQLTQRATGRIAAAESSDALFAALLESFVEVAGCRRGFVLAGDQRTGFIVRACRGVPVDEALSTHFAGSAGVIERALSTRQCLLVGDALSQAWTRGRASVVGQGIRAAACLPLQHDGALLGAIYADTDDGDRRFEALDAEMLEALGRQAALVLAALRLSQRLAMADRCLVLGADGAVVEAPIAPRWRMTAP